MEVFPSWKVTTPIYLAPLDDRHPLGLYFLHLVPWEVTQEKIVREIRIGSETHDAGHCTPEGFPQEAGGVYVRQRGGGGITQDV